MESHSITLQGLLEDAFEFDLLPSSYALREVLISHEVVVDLLDQVVRQVMRFAIPIEFVPQQTLIGHGHTSLV